MIIIGKEGCPDCKIFKEIFPFIPYYELPSKCEGLGDLIANLLKKINIYPCVNCINRQYYLNKLFPFKSNYNIDDYQKRVRLAVAKHKVKKFPVILSSNLEEIILK